MANGKIEFGVENIKNVFVVAKALLKEGYEVLLNQDELGNMMLYYNKVAWTEKTFTLISFNEIDLLHIAKEKKEIDE